MTYQDPDGEETLDPSEEQLRGVILGRGPEYYGNSGAAALYGSARRPDGVVTHGIHNAPSLCWFLEEPAGFHFRFGSGKGPSWITYDGSGPSPRVEHYLGGEPIYFPRGCFIARGPAWDVVRDFLRTQSPSPSVRWVLMDDLGVDPNDPE